MWPPIRQLKQSPSSCIRVTFQSLGPQPGSWVNWGANFMSSIIDEMCKLLGMRKLQTMLYHPQTNGLVERSHQTIMWSDWEVGRRQKGQLARTSGWNSAHLQCHLIHCDGVQSTLFNVWMQTKAPSWLLLPTFRRAEVPRRGASTKCVDEYIATVWDQLRASLQEAQIQLMAEAQWQKWYYDWKIGALWIWSLAILS